MKPEIQNQESLRDNMSTTELVLNMLAETATKELSQAEQPVGFEKSRNVAQRADRSPGMRAEPLKPAPGSPSLPAKTPRSSIMW